MTSISRFYIKWNFGKRRGLIVAQQFDFHRIEMVFAFYSFILMCVL